MSEDIALGGGREFDVIRRMRERWGALAAGIGDDAAILDVPRGDRLVASTDTAVEGVHFRREWVTLEEAGYRAVTAALSDLAAMAARPLGILLALELPRCGNDEIDLLADGIGGATRAAGTVIRGGNITSGPSLAITTTVFGSAYRPLSRNTARPGDHIYVTGRLGGPSAAVRAFSGGRAPQGAMRERFVRPAARLREAHWLAAHGASAMIDVSDGVGGDAGHLASASGVTLEIELDRVPLVEGAELGDVSGGEEYELLLTAPRELPERDFEALFGVPLTRIGTVSAGAAEAVFTSGGRRVATPRGWDHLSR